MKKYIFLCLLFTLILIYGCSSKDQETIGAAPSKIIDKTEKAANDVAKKYEQYNSDSILNDKGE